MRRILPLVLLAACAPAQPASMVAPAGPDALKCAASRMTALGYTVQGETSNTVRSERNYGGGMFALLTAATFDDQLRVETHAESRRGGEVMPVGPTGHTRADAQAVLDACGR